MGHKSKKTISIIVGFSGLLGLGLVVLAWLLSSSVMYPSYSCSEEHFIYCGDPSQLSMPFEDISFQSVDGASFWVGCVPFVSKENSDVEGVESTLLLGAVYPSFVRCPYDLGNPIVLALGPPSIF